MTSPDSMNSIIASDNCTLNHVHNISTIGSTLTPWTAEDTQLIEAIVNHGDRDRLAQDLPSLCSTQTADGVQVESWMSFLAGRIEWINTDDEQLQVTDDLYVFRMQLPWAQDGAPAIVLSKNLLFSIAQEENISCEMVFAFWCIFGLSIACLDPSNLLIPCGENSFEYRKGKVFPSGGFSSFRRRIAATELTLAYLSAYYGGRSSKDFDTLLKYLTCCRRGIGDGVLNFVNKSSSPALRIIYSEEKKITQEDLVHASQSKGLSGYLGIEVKSQKSATLYVEPDKMPYVEIRLTLASAVWYILLMQHPEGLTRKELFSPAVMRQYLTIEHCLHREDPPSDREVEIYCEGDKAIRDKFNKSLQRLRDTLKKAFVEHRGYDYSKFIPTEASTLTKSATRIAIQALQSPNKVQCYIPEEIKIKSYHE